MPGEWKLNRPHKCPKTEDLEINVKYAFSYSPDGRLLGSTNNDHSSRLADTIKHVTRTMKKLSHCHVICALESSSSGRFHYHGTIEINNIGKFILNDMPLLQKDATYEIDTIKDMCVWETYVYKQRSIWATLIESMNLPLNYRYIVTTGTQ